MSISSLETPNQRVASIARYEIVGVSILMALIMYLDRVCLAEIVKSDGFTADLQLNAEERGRLLGAFFFTYALFQVPAGWASDRFGARQMLTAYIALWSICTIAFGLAASFTALLVARLACGIAQAGAYPTSGGLVRRWFPITERGKASGLICFGGRIGGTIAPFLTAVLIGVIGWRQTTWMYGLAGLVIAILYWFVVRNRPSESSRCSPSEREWIGVPADDSPPRASDLPQLLLDCLTSFSLWCNSAIQFLVNIGWVYLVTWLPTYLKSKGVPPIEGSLLVSGALATGIAGQIFGGAVADFFVRRLPLRWARSVPLAITNTLSGIAYLLCVNADSVMVVVICCAAMSFLVDLGNPSIWAFMQDIGGKNTAAIGGWGNMWGNFGAAVSPMILPYLINLGRTPEMGQQIVFLTFSGSFFLAAMLALGMNATRPVQPARLPMANDEEFAQGGRPA